MSTEVKSEPAPQQKGSEVYAPRNADFDIKRQESIEFLSGKTDKTSWIDKSSTKIARIPADNSLLTINKLGLLIVTFRLGMFEREQNGGSEEQKKKLYEWANHFELHILSAAKRAQYVETRQRACIECICLRVDMELIVQALVDEHLWVQADGETYGAELEVIDLKISSIVTTEGHEAIAMDTCSHGADSSFIPDLVFGGVPGRKLTDSYCGLLVIDPLFRRNTLSEVVAKVLTKLQAEGHINAKPLI